MNERKIRRMLYKQYKVGLISYGEYLKQLKNLKIKLKHT